MTEAEFAATLGAISGLVGSAIGAGAVLFATFGAERSRRQAAAKAAAIAARGEVRATLEMLQLRDWGSLFEQAERDAANGQVFAVSIHVREDQLPLCRQALSHAGELPTEVVDDLARILMLAEGLLSDLRRLAEHGANNPQSLVSMADSAHAELLYGQLGHMYADGISTGGRLVAGISRAYPDR